MTETTLTGNLPNITMRISHRAEPDGSAEHMVIQLTALPNFEAALPLLGNLAPMPTLLAVWNAWMAPWTALARANPFLPPHIALLLGVDKDEP